MTGARETVLDLIDEATERDPERTAVICGDERLSYRQLDERSRRVAYDLIARGVGPERMICVAVEPSLWAPIAMLGVLRAGAAYVPLDPSYPRARIEDMLDQVGVPLVLTTTKTSSLLPPRATLVEIDRARGGAVAPTPSPHPDGLAYVIFTSGSTGRPKGVMVPHRGLANLVRAQIEMFAIDRDSVVLQFAPLSFDASVSEVFTALAAGATLCLAPRDELAPGPGLVLLAQRHRVTVATLPPSSLALIEPADFPTLCTVVSAGEACSSELVARWAPGRRFVNAYGPTEVTVCATMGACEPDGLAPGIGSPLHGTTTLLLDEHLAPVERGRVGEIYVGGVGVTRGYHGRAGLTAERFVPDPTTRGARMYRTGDLARYRDDGALEFVGRIDHQVKVRGYRIELGEVESVLRGAPHVRDALVLAREAAPGDVRLVAYLIGAADLDRAAVRAVVDARLPAFARPTDLVVLAEWPRTPAGKVDRDRLPVSVREGSTGSARSAIELLLGKIWEAVLGVSNIGPDDDFFDLGGHSLLAIRMLARVRAELEVDVPLSTMTQRRTVSALADLVASTGARVTLSSPLVLRAVGVKEPLFLVPPVSGSALAYLPLLRRLGADRPVYAFHAPGLDGGGPPPDRFEDLAAHFIRELLAIRPRGPYLLGGWSIGGALAFEMALQLRDLGHEVPVLIMLDSNAPSQYLADRTNEKFGELTRGKLAFMYVNNFGRCFGVDLALDKECFAGVPEDELERAALRELRRVPAFPPDIDESRLGPHLATFAAIGLGFVRWRPARRYDGRVVMFLAKDGHPEFDAGRYDWSELVEHSAATIDVPGSHFSLVNEPHVATLGEELDRVLESLP